MNRFEFFESGQGLIAARLGLISIFSLVRYDIYKSYKQLLADGVNPAEAKKIVCDRMKYHYSGVMKAIYFFEKDDPAILQNSEKIVRA